MKKIDANKKRHDSGGKLLSCIFGVFLLIIPILFLPSCRNAQTIKIGAIIPLSGSGAYLVDLRDAMVLAADEINARGGINGRKMELIIQDSESNPDKAKESFNKIEAAQRPLLYISAMSPISIALADLAEKAQVVLVGLVTTAPELTEGRTWTFRYYPMAPAEADTQMILLKSLNIKNLGILYQNDPYGLSVYHELKKRFEESGGSVKGEAFELNAKDFMAQIEKLKDQQAVYAVGLTSHFDDILTQLKQANYRGAILAASGAAADTVRGIPEADGVYVASPAIYNPGFLYAREADDTFKARYKKPLIHQAANGYDFIRLLSNLLEDEKLTRDNIRSILDKGFMYSGVFGDLTVKPGEHDIQFPLFPARIQRGEIKYQ